MGNSPTQIEVINKASGININDCFYRKNIISVDGIEIMLISKNDLITNKRVAGRDQDIADANKLEKITNKKEKIEEMECYKHEIKNEVLIDFRGNKIKIIKTEIVSEKDNICKLDCIDKKGKNIYILQQIKDNNTKRWYFDKIFNNKSALYFINYYNEKNKQIKNKNNKEKDTSNSRSNGGRK